jgi:hypothetical protein
MTSTVETPDWSTILAPIDDGATRHLTGVRAFSDRAESGDSESPQISIQGAGWEEASMGWHEPIRTICASGLRRR